MARSDVLVSVVTPIRDGREFIEAFLRELHDVLAAEFTDFELVVVDNGSTDGTGDVLEAVQRSVRNIQVYTLARPLHHDAAFMMGVEQAVGDVVLTMDPCFDPIDVVPRMIVMLEDRGVELVYGVRSDRTRGGSPFDRLARWFYGVFRRAASLEFPTGIGTLQLFSRTAVNAFVNHGDRYVLFKVISAITGLPYAELAYERVNRCASKRGRAGYRSAAGTAMMSLLLSSGRPLRLLTFLSIGGAGLNLLYSVYIVVVNILKDEVAEGWTSLSAQITGLFFILFLVLAVLSEFLLRIFSTQQNQLPYIVTRESSSLRQLRAGELNVIRSGPKDAGADAPDGERAPR